MLLITFFKKTIFSKYILIEIVVLVNRIFPDGRMWQWRIGTRKLRARGRSICLMPRLACTARGMRSLSKYTQSKTTNHCTDWHSTDNKRKTHIHTIKIETNLLFLSDDRQVRRRCFRMRMTVWVRMSWTVTMCNAYKVSK